MPRRRDEKSAAPSPSPRLSRRRAEEARSSSEAASVTGSAVSTVPGVDTVEETDEDETAEEAENGGEDEDGEEGAAEQGSQETRKPTLEERQAKLRELRLRMNKSTADNRRDLIEDHQKSRVNARELVRLEKQRKLAQTLRLKADAAENGEDLERRNAWKWSIEQNEQWERKQEESRERQDRTLNGADDEAFKQYRKSIRTTKPDLVGYHRQKEAALGLAPGTLAPLGATSDSLAAAGPSRAAAGLSANEDLYRDKDTLSYGDSKPSEDAVDRVVSKINKDIGKAKRKKKTDDDSGDVTYINKRNKIYNEKVAKYFDKYTKEIKANLERGTAL